MASAWKEDAQEAITTAIVKNLTDELPFVTGWVLIATFVDDDGTSCTAFNSMEDQKRTATLGMLHHASLVEQASIYWDEKPDE